MEGILFVAVGCGRVQGILDSAAKRPFVVFGTMDGQGLSDLAAMMGDTGCNAAVYFYESG